MFVTTSLLRSRILSKAVVLLMVALIQTTANLIVSARRGSESGSRGPISDPGASTVGMTPPESLFGGDGSRVETKSRLSTAYRKGR